MLRIYNTLTKKKEEFVPLSPPQIKMYTCGVTVYDYCHVGHGRSLYIFEMIRRYLTHKGFKVNLVRNITDIDDKIINKAKHWAKRENISLKKAFDEVRECYIRSYYEDLQRLEIPSLSNEPLATGCIPEMIDFISHLIKKGAAYQRGNNVYFSVRKFSQYGKLSGKKIDDLYAGVRIEVDPLKEDTLDFALWKAKKEDEPFWNSPFGEGRPGWHIECSVMAKKYLGEVLDIHGGGKDLIFPHHENEIAQSETFTGKPFSRFWIHHGLLTINRQKMAKSLGNFITLKEAIDTYSPDALKIFYLTTHYRNQLDFSSVKMKEAQRVEERILVFIRQMNSWLRGKEGAEETKSKGESFSEERLQTLYQRFIQFMDDDFNTPQGFSVIFDIIRVVNQKLDKEERFLGEAKSLVYKILDIFSLEGMVRELREVSSSGDVFSLDLERESFKEEGVKETIEVGKEFNPLLGSSPEKMLDEKEIEEKVKYRERLRKEKKFAEADAIRKELEEKGIVLEDQRGGKTIWYVKKRAVNRD